MPRSTEIEIIQIWESWFGPMGQLYKQRFIQDKTVKTLTYFPIELVDWAMKSVPSGRIDRVLDVLIREDSNKLERIFLVLCEISSQQRVA